MSERDFTKDVIDHGHRFGWNVVHFPTSIGKRGEFRTTYLGDGKGFPDIVAVRERIIFAELKIPPNKPTEEQEEWARRLTAAGIEVYLWTPADESDIVKVFAGVRPPQPAVLNRA